MTNYIPIPQVQQSAGYQRVTPKRRHAQEHHGCRHVLVRWQQVPHPKYGAEVAHFVSWEEEIDCDCVGNVIHSELVRTGGYR